MDQLDEWNELDERTNEQTDDEPLYCTIVHCSLFAAHLWLFICAGREHVVDCKLFTFYLQNFGLDQIELI